MTPRRSRAPRELYVTPLDVDLLAALRATRSIVEACSRVSISRDRGMYRLRRLARALGAPVVRSRRGGASRGQTVLTALGRRVLSQGAGGLRLGSGVGVNRPAEANVFAGTWRHAPQPRVLLDGGGSLFVTFAAREGEPVRVGIEPEVTFTGGVSLNRGMKRCLEEQLGIQLNVDPLTMFCGALGAAQFGMEKMTATAVG